MKIITAKYNSRPSKFLQFIPTKELYRASLWIEFWWINKTIQIAIIF